MGGEKAFLFSRGAPPWGSPPRGRGKDAVLVAALLHDRITPAWAGKRRCTARREPASRDHPRVGGEKLPSIISCIVQPGSPPRGRGKGLFSTIPGGCPGITPAWAGKRPFAGFEPAACGDHPRVGGEKTSCAMARPVAPGSPPRGRGKGRAHLCVRGTPRITPAWAGKRSARLPWRLTIGDHPRVGGEKEPCFRAVLVGLGSPPRGRGKGSPMWKALDRIGITPAWAGKSKSR